MYSTQTSWFTRIKTTSSRDPLIIHNPTSFPHSQHRQRRSPGLYCTAPNSIKGRIESSWLFCGESAIVIKIECLVCRICWSIVDRCRKDLHWRYLEAVRSWGFFIGSMRDDSCSRRAGSGFQQADGFLVPIGIGFSAVALRSFYLGLTQDRKEGLG